MTSIGKFAVELAEARVDQERDASVARVQASLIAVSGATHCAACDDPIPEGRRRALPSTRLCLDCAQLHEASAR